MTADSEKLHETLDQLHRQLDQAEHLDPELVAELKETMEEIQATLQKQDREADGEQGLVDRLNDSALSFQKSHPTIAGTVQRVIDMLAQMGI
jgi:hypothetical protein